MKILLFLIITLALLPRAEAKGPRKPPPNQLFNLRCHPFQPLERQQLIDKSCPSPTGNVADATSAHGEQNAVKNNFCAGTPFASITHENLLQLQTAIEKDVPEYPTWNRDNLPADRSVFKKASLPFREGAAVQYTGFLLEAHYADTHGGESVNCNTNGNASNDIHIALVKTATATNACESITAEITPHFRPTAWTTQNLTAQKPKRIRISGQLMFDAAHKPCTNGTANKSDPPRLSDWEIHPVYQVEICTNEAGGTCNTWTALK